MDAIWKSIESALQSYGIAAQTITILGIFGAIMGLMWKTLNSKIGGVNNGISSLDSKYINSKDGIITLLTHKIEDREKANIEDRRRIYTMIETVRKELSDKIDNRIAFDEKAHQQIRDNVETWNLGVNTSIEGLRGVILDFRTSIDNRIDQLEKDMVSHKTTQAFKEQFYNKQEIDRTKTKIKDYFKDIFVTPTGKLCESDIEKKYNSKKVIEMLQNHYKSLTSKYIEWINIQIDNKVASVAISTIEDLEELIEYSIRDLAEDFVALSETNGRRDGLMMKAARNYERELYAKWEKEFIDNVR